MRNEEWGINIIMLRAGRKQIRINHGVSRSNTEEGNEE